MRDWTDAPPLSSREQFVLEHLQEHDGTLVSAMARQLFGHFAHSTGRQYTWKALKSLEAKGRAVRARINMGNVLADVWRAV
jgi:hypothetical protein